MRYWIVNVGPNPGRGSTHAHGPVTSTGPVRVIPAEEMADMLDEMGDALLHKDMDPIMAGATLTVLAKGIREMR